MKIVWLPKTKTDKVACRLLNIIMLRIRVIWGVHFLEVANLKSIYVVKEIFNITEITVISMKPTDF